MSNNTVLTHSGRDAVQQQGFVNPAVTRGSTVLYPTAEDLSAGRSKYSYGRRGNPTTSALSEAMTEIEGGAGVVLTPSGLNAVTTSLLAVLSSGDHLLMVDTAYHPTRHFCDTTLARLGVTTTYYDPTIGPDIRTLFTDRTKAVFTESPGSLTFEIQDIPAIAEAAHGIDAAVLMDNTWATALYFDAHRHGVDISLQAGTKYLSGHSDVNVGTISANAKYWPQLKETHGNLGLCLSPDDAYLALRGFRTMGVRLARHHESGLAVARWLEARPEVRRVMHPALDSHPQNNLWKRDFRGASGLFSVEFMPTEKQNLNMMLNELKLFGMGYSWGGFESLAIPFDARTTRTATQWDPQGPTVRLHIGLEDVEDLLADLERGLAKLRSA
jgi:cystathionine beta-lyase